MLNNFKLFKIVILNENIFIVILLKKVNKIKNEHYSFVLLFAKNSIKENYKKICQ